MVQGPSQGPIEEEEEEEEEEEGKERDTQGDTNPTEATSSFVETDNEDTDVSSEDEEIIDIRQNTLYQVFACLLEDEKGDNLVEVLSKISENFEKHNQNLENLVEKVSVKSEDKLCERFDKQNKILARMAKSLDTYLSKKNNSNEEENNEDNNENND